MGPRVAGDPSDRDAARGAARGHRRREPGVSLGCRSSRTGSLAGRESGMDDQNLRGWITAVDELGELERLAGVDSDLELATITELVLRERQPPPAVLFDDIAGFPTGYRVLTGLSNT